MKMLALLACFISAVYCTGGLHEQDASTFPKYLNMALNELGVVTQEAASNVKVVRVQTQVMLHNEITVNFLNILTPKKFVVITLKFELCGSTIE